jgi:hypothetical protein
MNSGTVLKKAGEKIALPNKSCESALKITNQIHKRRIIDRQELNYILNLSDDKVQHLIDTRQITLLRIQGEERFDSMDIDNLINTYRLTAQRRAQ